MKFIHIADVHLGAEPDAGPLYSGGRGQELWDALESVVRVCEKERTDLLLVAGDLFHRQPLVRELREVNALFAGLTHTKVVLIAGNHDYLGRDCACRNFRWNDRVYPLYGNRVEYVDFPELGTAVYGMSYDRREITEPLLDPVRAAGVEPVEILLAHGGDDRHIPMDMDRLGRAGFDYVALGHIHRPGEPGKDRIVYAGALEPVDRNDTGEHGYVKGEITEQGIRTERVFSARRSYIHLSVRTGREDTMAGLREKIRRGAEHYGLQNMYVVRLCGRRDPAADFSELRAPEECSVLEIIDGTAPDYDFQELYEKNRDNILGTYIRSFSGCEEGSLEYQALCEGTEALLESRGK